MKKFFLQKDIPAIDRRTIELDSISSHELMERAARAASSWILSNFSRHDVVVVAGTGNNGGDGLAIARHLSEKNWRVTVFCYTNESGKRSDDNLKNMELLSSMDVNMTTDYKEIELLPDAIVVDALFGTGLSRPLAGDAAEVVKWVNGSGAKVISIDVPSGIGDESTFGAMGDLCAIRATETISFEFPKVAFMLPEFSQYVGNWHVISIALSKTAIDEMPTRYYYTDLESVSSLINKRLRFGHKGTFGHGLLIAGSYGMMGAATLAARGCMRSGVGLLSVGIPLCGYDIMQINVPEAMVLTSEEREFVAWGDIFCKEKITAVGIGPGMGRREECGATLRGVLDNYGGKTPIVIDADGLFHLAEMLKDDSFRLPPNCVVTPHVGEFDRLTRRHASHSERIVSAGDFAKRHRCVVILKGAYSVAAFPEGEFVFNTIGNAGMATAGSGDVLTGIVLGFLAQGYPTKVAAILSMCIHGAAGDVAAEEFSQEAMTASDIVNGMGRAFGAIGRRQ